MLQRKTLPDHDRPCDIRRVRRRGLRVHKRGRLLVGLCEVLRRETATRRQTVPQGNGRPIRIREYSRRSARSTIGGEGGDGKRDNCIAAKKFKFNCPNFYEI